MERGVIYIGFKRRLLDTERTVSIRVTSAWTKSLACVWDEDCIKSEGYHSASRNRLVMRLRFPSTNRLYALAVLAACAFGTSVFAKDFDHQAICASIKNGWAIRLVYRPGEG